jgi:hypothetical protein
VRDPVPRVDDRPREHPFRRLGRGPGRGEGQDSLHGNVQPGDVEGLKHDLRGVSGYSRRWSGSGRVAVVPLDRGDQCGSNGVK